MNTKFMSYETLIQPNFDHYYVLNRYKSRILVDIGEGSFLLVRPGPPKCRGRAWGRREY